jgi:hypothetical protein
MITNTPKATAPKPNINQPFSAGSVPKRAHGGNRNQKYIHHGPHHHCSIGRYYR